MRSPFTFFHYVYAILVVVFLFFPLVSVGFASFGQSRYLSFPIKEYTFDWYTNAFESSSVRELAITSLTVASIVAVLSVIIGFFGALAFARYSWRYKRLFQKAILLPIFFPQTVLGLALLLWFNTIGIIPDWRTAIVSHLVWISPIATLIISIRVFSLDPALEAAAKDLGASTTQILTGITLPLLSPAIVSAAIFAFLLSWGNFPLSLFTTGADSTLPEWLYAKMVSGYSPLVPAVGMLTVLGSVILMAAGLTCAVLYAALKRPQRNQN